MTEVTCCRLSFTGGMVVTLPSGDVTVKYGPGVQIVHQASGSASDLKPGVRVTVLSRDDAALNMGGYV